VYGAYDGISKSVPPGGGGALVAAPLLRTLTNAFVICFPTARWDKASPEIYGLPAHNAPNAFIFVHTAMTRRVTVEMTLE